MLLNDFKKNGFIILKKAFKKNDFLEILSLSTQLHDLYFHNQDFKFLDKYYLKNRADQGVLYDICQRYPEFRFILSNLSINSFLSDYYQKTPYVLYENSLVYKPPGQLNEVPAHQDYISKPNDGERLIIWIPFENVNNKSGSIQVVPGSHKNGYKSFYTIKGETHHTRVNINSDELNKFIDVEMMAGDVLIFHPMLIHKSKKVNISNKFRFAFRYAVQEASGYDVPRGSPIVLSKTNMDFFKPKRPFGFYLHHTKRFKLKVNIRLLKSQIWRTINDLFKK